MRIKIDENLPARAFDILQDAGHDVATVLEQCGAGAADSKIVALIQAESRMLITLDLDFADLRAYPPSAFAGIVVLRPRVQEPSRIAHLPNWVAAELNRFPVAGHLWVVDDEHVRVRGDKT